MKDIVYLKNKVFIDQFSSVCGVKEKEGPLGDKFDCFSDDDKFACETWEKSESAMQKKALEIVLEKACLSSDEIDYIFAGDLLNQCIGSSYGLRDFEIKMLGLYGACSTFALGAILAAVFVDNELAKNAVHITSSHFCSSERQFRFPLEYGGQRTPTSQRTATASGAVVINKKQSDIFINSFLIGKIIDYDITDINNMGAAMAPAAADTLYTYLSQTNTTPNDYDIIITGDLGNVGKELLITLMGHKGIDLSENYEDCGVLLFDSEKQDIHAGGSGCGCSAGVMCSHIFPLIKSGVYEKVLFIGTGALMSPTSVFQGESIPSIAHLVEYRRTT